MTKPLKMRSSAEAASTTVPGAQSMPSTPSKNKSGKPRKKPRKPSTKATKSNARLPIGRELTQAGRDYGRVGDSGSVIQQTVQKMCAKMDGRIGIGRISGLRRSEITDPYFHEVVFVARHYHRSIEALPDRVGSDFLRRREGLAWRLSLVPSDTRSRACQTASAMLLDGATPEQIGDAVAQVYAAREKPLPPLDRRELIDFVTSGLAMGLVRFETPPDATSNEGEDTALASELTKALVRDAVDRGTPERTPTEVRVVKNLAHPEFGLDPVAPFLIARVGHRIVARHIATYQTVYTVGFAGGNHCATFVRQAGPESSPFPDDCGDKRLTFVPLTLEPFDSHQLPMADGVVAEMVANARCLLGERRAKGETFHSFGYLHDERIARRNDGALDSVSRHYRDLDIAIYGCGDLENDGWLECALRRLNGAECVVPTTDICLNLIDDEGEPVGLPGGREFVGISRSDIQRVVERPERLALLLTSGAAKGRPIIAATRAGCIGSLVCDQAAARAAIEALEA